MTYHSKERTDDNGQTIHPLTHRGTPRGDDDGADAVRNAEDARMAILARIDQLLDRVDGEQANGGPVANAFRLTGIDGVHIGAILGDCRDRLLAGWDTASAPDNPHYTPGGPIGTNGQAVLERPFAARVIPESCGGAPSPFVRR